MVAVQQQPSLLVSSSKISAALVATVVQGHGLDPSSTTVLSGATYAEAPKGSFDEASGYYRTIVSIAPAKGEHSLGDLQQLSRILQPGGKIIIQEAVASSVDKSAPGPSRSLLLSGFISPEDCAKVHGDDLDLLKGNSLTWHAVSARKPDWEVGAKFSLRKGGKKPNSERPAEIANVWRMEVDKDDSELINEDDLLDEDDLAAPKPISASDSDVGGGRKACKNCTCGRAEGKMSEPAVKVDVNNPALTEEQKNNPQSACGSCGLGDAYRCASCPYLGLPAFKLGEKIELADNMLDADI